MLDVLRDVGGVICGASDDLAPADRRLYALRDVTGTVEAIPLIASSIMSKKIAEGTDALVLDVKVGAGAFLPDVDDARRLAETMVGLGRGERCPDRGPADGHGPAARRRLRQRARRWPRRSTCSTVGGPDDVVAVTVALAREMLALAGLADAPDPADVLASGSARPVWDAMVRAQGGDPDAPIATAPHVRTFPAPTAGFVRRLDAKAVGVAAWRLGAGRARKEDPVSAVAGIRCLAKVGDRVEAGQPWLELHAEDPTRFHAAEAALAEALADSRLAVGPEEPEPRPLVIDRIT